MLARLLFDESLAELADELLLLEDEDVSAADAEAPRRNARIARVDDAELQSVAYSQSTKSSTTSP
jgi:transglutaminase/protease-like cytokinesis protein 3